MLRHYFIISFLIGAVVCYLTGLWVYFINKTKQVNRAWFLLSLSAGMWSLGHFVMAVTKNYQVAWAFCYILYGAAILIPSFYLYFVLSLIEVTAEKKKEVFLSFLISLALLLILPTKLFMQDVMPKLAFNYYDNPGPLCALFLLFFMFVPGYAIVKLFLELKKATGIKKMQLKYVAIASIFGFIGGGSTFPLAFNIQLPPYLIILFPLYPIIITVGIIRYRLLDINILLTRGSIFITVYAFVLGIPFWVGFKTGLWNYSTIMMTILATAGPFIYYYFRTRAENTMLKEQKHTHEILRVAARGVTLVRDLDKLLNLIVRVLTKTLTIKYASVYLLDRDTNRYCFYITRGGKPNDLAIDSNSSLVKYLQGARRPIVYEELQREYDDRKDAFLRQIIDILHKIDADLLIPSFIEGDLIGFLALGNKKSGAVYSNDDISVLSDLANQCALAIENAQFLKERERIQEKLKEAEILTATGDLLGSVRHEIGNILNKISFPIQMVKAGDYKNKPEKEQQAFDDIMENILLAKTILRYVDEYKKKSLSDKILPYNLNEIISQALANSNGLMEK